MKNILAVLTLSTAILSQTAMAKDKGIIGNFSRVNQGLYRGARPANIAALDYLAKLGIKSIVNLQGGDLLSKFKIVVKKTEAGERPEVIAAEKANTIALGMNFLHSSLDSLDAITADEDKLIDQTLEYMHDPNNQPVFIHCEHGKDRTGLLVALYEVKYEGADVGRAHEEWVANGHTKISQKFTGKLDKYYYKKVQQFNK